MAAALAAALATGSVSAAEMERYPAPPGTRLVIAAEGLPSPLELLERHGFRVAVAIPPTLYYVIERRGVHLLPAGFTWGGPSGPSGPSAAGVAAARDPFVGRVDVLPPLQPPPAGRTSGAARFQGEAPGLYHGTRWGDTTEFMIGRVAVGILLAESDGTLDPNHYDWTPALRDSLTRAAVIGLARWAVRAAGKGIPLTFLLELHPSLPTRYEPIDREVAQEAFWIADVLAPLVGRSGDATGEAYEFANGLRGRLGTQWAFILFGVQNDTDPDGLFPDGYVSHSRLGGPWIVMPLKEPAGALDYYIEHETTHMFWALDEYPAAGPGGGWWFCTLQTGYFAYPNTNSSIPYPGWCWADCPGCPHRCVMDGNYPGEVCPYTEGQIGWLDGDASGKLDFFETRAGVEPDSTRFHVLAGQVKSLHGVAREVALRNQNPYRLGAGDSISVAWIDSVQMRVAGGPWMSLPPRDGRYDTGQEEFAGDVGPFPAGNYLVEWRAWNSNDLVTTTPASAILEVTPSGLAAGFGDAGAAPPPSLRAGPNPSRGSFSFTLTARPGVRGVARLHDAAGRLVWREPLVIPPSGRVERVFSAGPHDGAPAASGLYFLAVEVEGAKLTRRLVLIR
jgi:hypothetical protein